MIVSSIRGIVIKENFSGDSDKFQCLPKELEN